jgi:hypothetical protein
LGRTLFPAQSGQTINDLQTVFLRRRTLSLQAKYLPDFPPFPVQIRGSKCDELTDFWVKSEQSARRVNNCTDVPGKTTSHLVFFS